MIQGATAIDVAGWFRYQSHQGEIRYALSAAAFSNQANCFARLNSEGNTSDSTDDALVRLETDRQIVDLQLGFAHIVLRIFPTGISLGVSFLDQGRHAVRHPGNSAQTK